MFAKSIRELDLREVERINETFCKPTIDELKRGGYRIYTDFDVSKNALVYGAVAMDFNTVARNGAMTKLFFSVDSTGKLLSDLRPQSAALIAFIREFEDGKSDEELAGLYGQNYTKITETAGLSPEEAQTKLEQREDFRAFLNKLDKEPAPSAQVTDSRLNVLIGLSLENKTDARVSVTVISQKKESPVKDLYKFLSGFSTRESYPLSAKESVVLEGSSFASPYNAALPVLASTAQFYKKAKTTDVAISYDRLLTFLDIIKEERVEINGKRTKIKIKEDVSISVGEDGVPSFTPPFQSADKATKVGKEGVYLFDPKNGVIEFHAFQSNASAATYQYFRQRGLQNFRYISDLFSKELLPKIAHSVQLKGRKSERAFAISLYLSYDDQERLSFKTEYLENGEPVKRDGIGSEYGKSIAGAYLTVLESLSGLENGALTGERAYAFLKRDLSPLQGLCDLFCDERLKPGHVKSFTGLRVSADRSGGYLDLTLDHDKYTQEELSQILLAYEKKKKYYLLKDSTILLDGEELSEAGSIFRNGCVHLEKAPVFHLFSLDGSKLKVRETDSAKKVLSSVKDFKAREYSVSPHFRGDLKPYQADGVKYLKTISENGLGAILADEMGLGKTVETIAYFADDPDGLHMVICPKAVVYNWESEIRRFSDLKPVVVDGQRDSRQGLLESVRETQQNGLKGKGRKKKDAYASGGMILLTSYDTFRRDASLYEGIRFRNVFLDEAQSVKNAFSQRHQALSSLNAEHRFALTGTPLENSQMDLWSIFDYLMPGYLRSMREFESGIGESESTRRIAGLVKPFILRRLKKDVIEDLPDLTESNIVIAMDDSQRALYLSTLENIRRSVATDSRITILAGLTRLRQLCVDPGVVFENYENITPKLLYGKDLIAESNANGHKVIVFSSFKSVLVRYAELLREEDISCGMITGDTSAKERLSLAEEFNTGVSLQVMLVSLKAGGVGLNLTGADTVLLLDPWWNPSAEAQASGRAHRIGQKNNVTVYRLIAKDSIEEKVQTLQQMKKELFDAIVEGTGGANKLTDEDIAYLMS